MPQSTRLAERKLVGESVMLPPRMIRTNAPRRYAQIWQSEIGDGEEQVILPQMQPRSEEFREVGAVVDDERHTGATSEARDFFAPCKCLA
jgi:hypothetical protein